MSGLERLTGFHGFDAAFEARDWDGKANSGVVPLRASSGFLRLWAERNTNANHAPVDVHERPAVIGWAQVRIGLDRFAGDAVQRRDDSCGKRGPRIPVADAQGD